MSDPSNPPRSASRAGYCLWCFHQDLGAHGRCPECGKTSPPSMRAQYWTRHPRMRALEAWSKALVLVFALAGSRFIPGAHGWEALFPLMFAVGGWKTAQKWTRREPYFDAHLVWITYCVLLAGVFGGMLIASGRPGGIAWGVATILGFLLLAVAVHRLCLRALRWKHALTSGERRIGGGARGASG